MTSPRELDGTALLARDQSNTTDMASIEAAPGVDIELDGHLGLAQLPAGDGIYQIAAVFPEGAAYVNSKRHERLLALWRDIKNAEKSNNSQTAFNLFQLYSKELDEYYHSLVLQRQVNSFARPNKGILGQYLREASLKLQDPSAYLADGDQHWVNLHYFGKLDVLGRGLLDYKSVRSIFQLFPANIIDGTYAQYILLGDEPVYVIKMFLLLWATLIFFCGPVVVLSLGMIKSSVAIAIFYGSMVILACLVSTLMFDFPVAMTMTLGVAALLGNAILRS
ncbi:hypothetical protein PT974_06864 [Cladobotryum mycophilum]|uniref:Uncharacterized protein n=1 Tax=Cladobotryum mycophilum TaxID=491253 RepID=A0ABR0SMM9_9HYPO